MLRAKLDRLFTAVTQIEMRGFAFFVVVPLSLAALSATETGYNRALGYTGAMLYLTHLAVIPWWIAEGTTKLVWYCCRRYRPPLWLTCTLGALLASAIVSPYVTFVSSVFESHWPMRDGVQMISASGENRLVEGLVHTARAIVFWTAANYAFDRLLGYPRFRNEGVVAEKASPPRSEAEEEAGSGLLQRLQRFGSLSEIILVKAEEHYVRVRGDHAEELIAYRFGQALQDLHGEEGFQVHRSYWVRSDAILRTEDTGARMTLITRSGLEIPVSRPYHALVRQAL
ncbi:MAG: LytTR family DNA-binding domain-containing protein [Pseudomonadota bacterium]